MLLKKVSEYYFRVSQNIYIVSEYLYTYYILLCMLRILCNIALSNNPLELLID